MKFEVRKPRMSDTREIDELYESTVQDNFTEEGIAEGYSKEVESLKDRLRTYFGSSQTDNVFLIATFMDKIVGTVACGAPNSTIERNLKIDHTNTPEVKGLYILPDYQSKGIGTLLLKEILLKLQSNGIKSFCLDARYKRAQSYWVKRIGNPKEVLPDYWGEGNHHLIWHCEVATVLDLISMGDKESKSGA